MSNSYLVLDLDGVLNNREHLASLPGGFYTHDESEMLSPGLLKLLDEVITKTSCSIVISSSWRIGKSVEWFTDLFTRVDYGHWPVVGLTPSFNWGNEDPRSYEIKDWIRNNLGPDYLSKGKWAVIDDSNLKFLGRNFVRTNVEVGITFTHVEKLVALLS